MSVPDNNTENHEVVLRELSWLPGNKLARFSAAETLEPAPVNLENVTQKLHSMKTPPGKTQSRRVSQCGNTLSSLPVLVANTLSSLPVLVLVIMMLYPFGSPHALLNTKASKLLRIVFCLSSQT